MVAAARQRSYDFAVIRGANSGDGVRRDFKLYGPMVRHGGLVLFDAYDTTERPEIKPAVDAAMASSPGWQWLGSDWRTGIARRKGNSSERQGRTIRNKAALTRKPNGDGRAG